MSPLKTIARPETQGVVALVVLVAGAETGYYGLALAGLLLFVDYFVDPWRPRLQSDGDTEG